jgi:Uma2 family endonuclease
VAVIRGSEHDFWDEHPSTAERVLEVCVSSRDDDRSKLGACPGAAVKEAWFVLVLEKPIEFHSRPVNGRFTEKKSDDAGRVICGSLPQFELKLDEFFEK